MTLRADKTRGSGTPLWGLTNMGGELMKCYLDPAGGEDEWLVTIWKHNRLLIAKVCSPRAEAHIECGSLRDEMLAAGWKEPTVE
jgi:hypothetical protein